MLQVNQLCGFGVGASGYPPGTISKTLGAGQGNATSGTTYAVNFNGVSGRTLVVVVAADNNGVNGVSSFAGITVATGGVNQQTVLEAVYDPGAAGAGAGLAVYTFDETYTGVNTVTINFSPATVAKAVVLWGVSHTGGAPVSAVASNTAGGTGTAPSVTLTGVLAGDLLIGCQSTEARTASTTDAAWGTSFVADYYSATGDSGTAATSMQLDTQLRTASAGGSYTFAPTLGTSRDYIAGIVAIRAAT
jgi:hypothetical protein